MSKLSHFDARGRPVMVDVSAKPETARAASARGLVRMPRALLAEVRSGTNAKGDVIAIAELAGIMAAKKTSDLIPLCHPLPLSSVKVRIEVDEQAPGLVVTADVKTTGRTGVEMEALCAVSVACLAVYDMLKAASREISIERICMLAKSGGRSGEWRAD